MTTTTEWVALGAAGLASLGVWTAVASRALRGGDLLAYEPRRRVPWNAGVGMLAFALLILSILDAAASRSPLSEPGFTADRFTWLAIQNAVMQIGMVAMGVAMLVTGLGATPRDLGLPRGVSGFAGDVRLGLLTAVAAMLPVYTLQIVLIHGLQWQSRHPTLEQLQANAGFAVAAAAFLAAAVSAPLFEEFLFRLLLQGWLEKVEDRLLAWRPTERVEAQPADEQAGPSTEETAPVPNQPPQSNENPYASPQAVIDHQSIDALPPLSPAEQDARRSLASFGGLTHGWAPVLASAMLFALVHLNQGPAVLPLFLFGVILGCVYQRTHRIVPCIVAHAAFNAFSLTLVLFSSR